MRFPRIRSIHRWISLTFIVVWILQASSGLAIGFRANIDDFFLGQSGAETDASALAGTVAELQSKGDEVSSIWISGGREGQYDAYLTRDGDDRTVRINGSGSVVRDRSDSQLFSDGAIFETLTRFHKSLLVGSIGYVFLLVSGVLLATNICLGLCIGWPQRRRLKAFSKSASASAGLLLSGWHWRIGFWGALPALVVILSGTSLTQSDVIAGWLGVEQPSPESTPSASAPLTSLSSAIEIALAEYPGSSLVAINLPVENRPWYRFRLNAPGEMPRLYGATRVFVGLDGAVLLEHDAAESAPNERIIEALYPLHTGQIGGLPGRLLNTAVGIWLLVMMVLGLRLWLIRRRNRASAPSRSDSH